VKAVILAACLTSVATPLIGQTPIASSDSSNNGCLVLNGIRIGADWGDSATPGASTRRDSTGGPGSFRLGRGVTLDTTITFDVSERQWSRSWLSAYVAGGVSGHTRSATRTNDPRTSWHACVGAMLGMQQPRLVMRGVHGQMHLKVDLTPLTRIPGATLDSSRQNQLRR
jgi:hypothetical protein